MRREYSIAERLFWLLALSIVVFFAHWRLLGLQPDAALYAGLSAKVLRTGESWLLSGSPSRFPQFFEHPPFFFQWGAGVLKRLGQSDGAARAIGGIPGALGFLSLVLWTWWRMGWECAVLCALMLASFGQYTKYAATSMMEGPLSLAVAWVAIATYELHWKAKTGWSRPLFWLLLFPGLALACASKGVAGLGAWGGLGISLIFALFLSRREPFKVLFSMFFMPMALAIAAAPLAYWAFSMLRFNGRDWISGYFFDQVFRSATSNRGEGMHPVAGDKLFYVKLILKTGWPWWWAVAAGILLVMAKPALRLFRDRKIARDFFEPFLKPVTVAWTWNALAFFLAFFIPFSLVKFQLPHYIHPAYLVLMPIGAAFLIELWPSTAPWRFSKRFLLGDWRPRWIFLALLTPLLLLTFHGVSGTPNRGQPFIAWATKIEALPPSCVVDVSAQSMDEYRMESFALWYWKGRLWTSLPNKIPAKIAVPKGHVYWEPEANLLWGRGECAP